MTSSSDSRIWLDSLPSGLARQRTLLLHLLDAVERDARWRWLEIGCSVAQGRGDTLSDLDLRIGVTEEAWPDSLDDPDALRADRWSASVLQADAASVREWTFLGCTALSDLAKYLRRSSPWEALERLEQARGQVWRLWATVHGIRYPLYGLTAVLDHPEVGIPGEIEATVAGLDVADLLRAALVCATLLETTAESAGLVVGGEVPAGMGRFVRKQLEDLADELRC